MRSVEPAFPGAALPSRILFALLASAWLAPEAEAQNHLYTFDGDGPLVFSGSSVGGAGDVNQDGYPDLVVGALYDDNNGGASGSARVLSVAKPALTADRHVLSLSTGGTQGFLLAAGPAHGGKFHLLLGTMSGTKPGLKLGPVTLPLNPDLYLGFTLGSPNTLILNSLGLLDASGRSRVSLELPPGLAPGLAGSLLHHAYLVFRANPPSFDLASNPRPLTLVK